VIDISNVENLPVLDRSISNSHGTFQSILNHLPAVINSFKNTHTPTI